MAFISCSHIKLFISLKHPDTLCDKRLYVVPRNIDITRLTIVGAVYIFLKYQQGMFRHTSLHSNHCISSCSIKITRYIKDNVPLSVLCQKSCIVN